MYKKSILTLAISGIFITQSSLASNYQHSTRAVGMGGVGVAISDPSSAPIFNPALLSSSRVKEGFSLILPSIYVGAADPDDFVDALDDFQDADYIDQLSDSIDNALLPGSFSLVADNAELLSQELLTLNNKNIEGFGGMYTSIALPSKDIGLALTASASVNLGGVINYEDADALSMLSDDLRTFEGCIEDNLVALGSCLPNSLDLNFIDTATGDILFDVNDDLTSSVEVYGFGLAEIGLSLSTSMELSEASRVSFGITPKMVYVEIFDYIANVDSADIDDFDGDDYVTSETDFNIDAGLFVELDKNWSIGLGLHNLISKEYETERFGVKTGRVIELTSKAVFGGSYENEWLVASIDLDVNKTPYLNGQYQQMIGVGAEFDAWDVAQLRLGFSHDIQNNRQDQMSVGLGFSPFGVHFDIGATGNKDEVVVAGQMGFKW